MGNLKISWDAKEALISNFKAVESNNASTFNKKTIAKILKDFFSRLAESLSIKLHNAPKKMQLIISFSTLFKIYH